MKTKVKAIIMHYIYNVLEYWSDDTPVLSRKQVLVLILAIVIINVGGNIVGWDFR